MNKNSKGDTMDKIDRIRNRVGYQQFSKLLAFLNKNPKRSEKLSKVHDFIDDHRGFHTARKSFFAMKSIEQLIKDKRIR